MRVVRRAGRGCEMMLFSVGFEVLRWIMQLMLVMAVEQAAVEPVVEDRRCEAGRCEGAWDAWGEGA